MISIVKREQVYIPEYHSYCLKNCIKHVLDYYISRDSTIFINCALDLILNVDQSSTQSFDISYSNNVMPVLPPHDKKVKTQKMSAKESLRAWNTVKNIIDTGIPVILGVDVYYLRYQSCYKKNHGSHAVILCGYSDEDKTAYIIDWYQPHFFKGSIDQEELNLARTSENPWDGNPFSGLPIMNVWTELDPNGWVPEPEHLLERTVSLTLYKYFYHDKTDDGEVYYGIAGLEKLTDIIEQHIGSATELKKMFLKSLHTKLYMAMKSKRLFRLYMGECQNHINMDILKNVCALMNDLTAKWDVLLTSILKGSFVGNEQYIINTISKLKEIINMEYGLFELLTKLAQKL